jgi:hypothetical protein
MRCTIERQLYAVEETSVVALHEAEIGQQETVATNKNPPLWAGLLMFVVKD